MGVENFMQDNEDSPRKPSESPRHFERDFISSFEGGRYELEERDNLYKKLHDPKLRGLALETLSFHTSEQELDDLTQAAIICRDRGWVEGLRLVNDDQKKALDFLLKRGEELVDGGQKAA